MLSESSSLVRTISERIAAAGADPNFYFRDSVEIVVFGSVAAGLERQDSDIDVLCVGGCEGRLKTDRLDLLAISESKFQERHWQQSELAGHIYVYGIWLQGDSHASHFMGFSQECIEAKRRRVAAFMRRLPEAWEELGPDFRIKYLIKVRREAQRLIRIESHIAVPPTRVLDDVPPDAPERFEVCDRLRKLIGHQHPDFFAAFLKGMLREWDRPSVTD
jgi:predicted nucleotidyltransferase